MNLDESSNHDAVLANESANSDSEVLISGSMAWSQLPVLNEVARISRYPGAENNMTPHSSDGVRKKFRPNP
jgi:hypothetical protein